MKKYVKISAKEAYKIYDEQGLDYGDDGITYYVLCTGSGEVLEFDSKKERDEYVEKYA